MSALESGPTPASRIRSARRDDDDRPQQRRLTVVAPPATPLRRTPFLLVLAMLLGVGMVGVLVLNTTLQSQAFTVRTLDREAALLANQQAQLETRVDELRTPQTLAEKAATLGMRPNQHPAFVKLPEGTIVGNPQKVDSDALPPWLRSTAEEIEREKRAREAAEKRAAEEERRQKAAEEARKKAAEAKKKKDAEAKKKKKAAEDDRQPQQQEQDARPDGDE